MSKVLALKKKAVEFEQKRQYDKALTAYKQALAIDVEPGERDIQLYNRAGDICLRQHDFEQAISYYEQAIDLYMAGGFFSNAIALCNKVLRHDADRDIIFYKLGKISASRGFHADAKTNFLEYAVRMRKRGRADAAIEAILEFVELCPDQDEVRLLLADELGRANRPKDALEQLQIHFDALVAAERHSDAAATLERMRNIDPEFIPRRRSSDVPVSSVSGLVFINLDD